MITPDLGPFSGNSLHEPLSLDTKLELRLLEILKPEHLNSQFTWIQFRNALKQVINELSVNDGIVE